jgi:holliday junction DNA helicase RuvA
VIGYLEGIVFEVESDTALVQVNGVGYSVSLTAQALADFQVLIGQKVKLWVYSHIREDAFQLFGFLTKAEKDFFTQLLKVNGVGPKSALTIMSGAPVAQIQDWIENSDVKALSSLPKLGKKTAEQIVLTLQGKLVRVESKQKGKTIQVNETHRQVASALVNLGFKNQNVEQFIATLSAQVSLEDGVREGLRKLSGQL